MRVPGCSWSWVATNTDEVASWTPEKREEARRAGCLDRMLTEEWFDEWRKSR